MRIPHVIHPHIAAIVQTEMSLAIDIPAGIQLCVNVNENLSQVLTNI